MTGEAPPAAWASCKVGELFGAGDVFADGDWVESKDQDPTGDVRLTQLADVGDGVWRNRSDRFMSRKTSDRMGCTYLEAGDVLVARMPDPLGRACIFPGDPRLCVTVVDVAILRPAKGVDRRYLMHVLNSPQIRREIDRLKAGTTRKRISRKNLATIQVPLAPQNEQRRIVDELERRLSHIDAAVSSLRSVARSLVNVRRSVLRSAAEGSLQPPATEDSLEPLLRRSKVPYQVDETRPGWLLVRLADIATVGSGSTPKRGDERYWLDGDIPWVTSGQIPSGTISKPTAWITKTALKETSVKLWPAGTLLLAMYGEGRTRGMCAELAIEATCNQACAAIALRPELAVFRPFVKLALQSRYDEYRNLGGGGVQENLNLGIVKDIVIPLPGIAMQQVLVAEAERRLSLIDAAERTVRASLAKADQVRRALLHAAFSGQLVPQDPDDEPADALLERIRAERAAKAIRVTRAKPGRTRPSKRKEPAA